ncbi:GNAT family N-acetyltransferase [Brachybacterium saurashtrense]|uniref:GNAT family N-acetyltransferase n=1 Tax=Brachybacterium saurashtrense TaxID=556288 RepID=A0A345YMF3_9MICO|nr:GNAT family N-acetyltransferase [Brachybacterium saurashtrense]AXK45105.1 GNAT family N-acetyltransferase [Brachybacterium saurashtrense]RRR22142.1 GNAT family N-acetyltransferase [Brachybacterium saurashtrense]
MDSAPPGSGRPFRIRPAVPGDADGCARVHHTSWVETYSALLPASHWETDTLARREQRWRRSLENGAEVTVAEAGGEIIGFAMAGAARRIGESAPVRERELFSLYLLAAHHGGGAGQALLEAVLPAPAPAQLWVAEQNPRARRFYGRNGFLPDGARFRDETLGLAEVRLVR